jgi:glycosyltransferase involved in cell wall biosynthesis
MDGLLSIVVPVFNEADSIEPLHAEIEAAVAGLGPFEVVYVDDGSTDTTREVLDGLVATRPNVRVVRLRRNFGKAAALTHGFANARGDVIVTMDGDRQDDPDEIPKLLARLDDGYDLVSGWKQSRQDPLSKRLPSKLFNWTVSTTTGIELHDFNCGLKAYRREVVEHVVVYGELHRYIPVLASDLGFRVTEEKVAHRRRTTGRSKYGWRRYARGYLDLLTVLFLGRYKQRPQHLFGGIGTIMLVVGVAIDLYLTVLKILGHSIGQRPLLLLGTLLIIVGIQFLSLGLIGELVTHLRARDTSEDYQVAKVFGAGAAALPAAAPAPHAGRGGRAPRPPEAPPADASETVAERRGG